jgi:hypothetical protein
VTRYADRLLASGERVALRGRQHILATIIEGRLAWGIFIAAVVLLILITQLERNTPDVVRQGFSILALGLLLIGLAWLTQIYLDWYNQDYVITNRRVMKVEGILSKRSADSSLEKINDAVLEQSLFGRMLGYGDLDILTANEQSVDRYRMLSEAQTFKKTMLDEKHKLEQDVFQIPAPPLRAAPAAAVAGAGAATATMPGPSMGDPGMTTAAVEPAPASGAHAAPATAPAPRQMTSEEITRAVGDLADLRDRGAISPEEYEAKKQDLLERL